MDCTKDTSVGAPRRTGRWHRSAGLAAVLALASLPTLPAPAAAQDGSPASDAEAVERVIRDLFDAMAAGDSAAAREQFAAEARLERTVTSDGETRLQVVAVEDFLASIGGAGPGRLEEEIWDVRVRVDGKLATAWMPYRFYLDGAFHHCGVNAFRLYETSDGWKIFGIADTSRTEGCPEPPDA